ncbi:MAG: YraN family protein [Nitrospinales bacterium]
MTKKRLNLGRVGEDEAIKFVKKQGYRILQTNFKTKSGEIDIIAEDKKVVAFIEVKTRTTGEYGSPLEAVNHHKQNKIVQVANQFLVQYKVENRECRFDIVAINAPTEEPSTWEIELIKDAFSG